MAELPFITTPSDRSGTFEGMFGHSNINRPSNWSWESEAQQYRTAGEERQAELRRHSHLLHTEAIRHPERFSHLQSAYKRGMQTNEKVLLGTSGMGEFSRLEQIQSARERSEGPIPRDDEREDLPQPRSRSGTYDPILQMYHDEMPQERDGRFETAHRTPLHAQPREEEDRSAFLDAASPKPPPGRPNKERKQRTAQWMPGRPKGGRSYRAAVEKKNGPTIPGDAPEESTTRENEQIRANFQQSEKERYNTVFQVYPDISTEVRESNKARSAVNQGVAAAQNRRMVREGG
jgi:hypothetical protein